VVAGFVPLRHGLAVEVSVSAGWLESRVVLAGSVLGVRRRPVPTGLGGVWSALDRPVLVAAGELAEAGDRLAAALFEPGWLDQIGGLVDAPERPPSTSARDRANASSTIHHCRFLRLIMPTFLLSDTLRRTHYGESGHNSLSPRRGYFELSTRFTHSTRSAPKCFLSEAARWTSRAIA
jgi:hypothetical protein